MARITFCVPCGPTHIPLLNRTLYHFAQQSCMDFEVVVCFDNFDGAGLETHPFVRTTKFVRPVDSAHLAHRNHCRNAAATLATGDYFWFWDADVLPGEDLVQQALRIFDTEPKHLSICPVMFALKLNRGVVLSEVSHAGVLFAGKPEDTVYPYTGHKYQPSTVPTLDPKLRISEGYPCVPRAVFELLGGFDKRYLGWGRNKEEFVLRLNALAPVHKYQLLRSVQSFVLPHDPDPAKRDLHHMHTNDVRFRGLSSGMADWGPDLRKRYQECCS